jgi:hypothetical protein
MRQQNFSSPHLIQEWLWQNHEKAESATALPFISQIVRNWVVMNPHIQKSKKLFCDGNHDHPIFFEIQIFCTKHKFI